GSDSYITCVVAADWLDTLWTETLNVHSPSVNPSAGTYRCSIVVSPGAIVIFDDNTNSSTSSSSLCACSTRFALEISSPEFEIVRSTSTYTGSSASGIGVMEDSSICTGASAAASP